MWNAIYVNKTLGSKNRSFFSVRCIHFKPLMDNILCTFFLLFLKKTFFFRNYSPCICWLPTVHSKLSSTFALLTHPWRIFVKFSCAFKSGLTSPKWVNLPTGLTDKRLFRERKSATDAAGFKRVAICSWKNDESTSVVVGIGPEMEPTGRFALIFRGGLTGRGCDFSSKTGSFSGTSANNRDSFVAKKWLKLRVELTGSWCPIGSSGKNGFFFGDSGTKFEAFIDCWKLFALDWTVNLMGFCIEVNDFSTKIGRSNCPLTTDADLAGCFGSFGLVEPSPAPTCLLFRSSLMPKKLFSSRGVGLIVSFTVIIGVMGFVESGTLLFWINACVFGMPLTGWLPET